MKARVIPCPDQPPTRGDNTVSVAHGDIATPGTTNPLLPPDSVFKTKSKDYIVRSSSFLMQFVKIQTNDSHLIGRVTCKYTIFYKLLRLKIVTMIIYN